MRSTLTHFTWKANMIVLNTKYDSLSVCSNAENFQYGCVIKWFHTAPWTLDLSGDSKMATTKAFFPPNCVYGFLNRVYGFLNLGINIFKSFYSNFSKTKQVTYSFMKTGVKV